MRSLYERCQACGRVLGQNSDWFEVEQGVRQGCVMSPWLFNLYMDNIVKEARQKFVGGVQMEGKDKQTSGPQHGTLWKATTAIHTGHKAEATTCWPLLQSMWHSVPTS